jgi:hypothetical protein
MEGRISGAPGRGGSCAGSEAGIERVYEGVDIAGGGRPVGSEGVDGASGRGAGAGGRRKESAAETGAPVADSAATGPPAPARAPETPPPATEGADSERDGEAAGAARAGAARVDTADLGSASGVP